MGFLCSNSSYYNKSTVTHTFNQTNMTEAAATLTPAYYKFIICT